MEPTQERGAWVPSARSARAARRTAGRDDLVELLLHVLELAAQRPDARFLICRRLALVAKERAVELIGVLADSLLARDRSAFLGGHDLPAHLFQPIAERLELCRLRIALGQLPGLFG